MKKMKEFVIHKGMILKRKNWRDNQAVRVESEPEFCMASNNARDGGEMVFQATDIHTEKPVVKHFFARPFMGERWQLLQTPKKAPIPV